MAFMKWPRRIATCLPSLAVMARISIIETRTGFVEEVLEPMA